MKRCTVKWRDVQLNEEMYSVLDKIILEVEDVLLSCNENAELNTKPTIKNLFRSDHFNWIDSLFFHDINIHRRIN